MSTLERVSRQLVLPSGGWRRRRACAQHGSVARCYRCAVRDRPGSDLGEASACGRVSGTALRVWYCHKLLTVVSIVSLGAHIICYYDQYTLAMSFFSITRIVFWATLGILQLKTRKHTRKSRREVLQVNYSSSETSGYTHEEPQHRAVGFKTFMRALTSKNDSRYRSGANGAHLPLLG